MNRPLSFGQFATTIDALPTILHRLPRATEPDLRLIVSKLRHAADRIEAVAECMADQGVVTTTPSRPSFRLLPGGRTR